MIATLTCIFVSVVFGGGYVMIYSKVSHTHVNRRPVYWMYNVAKQHNLVCIDA
jgi:hypothetical protein